MRRVTSLERLYDFLAVVVVCAPDRFPPEDYLAPEDQLNLERAFEEMDFGMQFVAQRIKNPSELFRLKSLLHSALIAYRSGEDVKAAHMLHDFESVVFGTRP